MARQILVNWQFNGNQALGLRMEVLASDPTGGDLYEGRLWFNSTSNLAKYYDGTSVIAIGTGVEALTVDNSSIEDIGTASNPSIRVKALGITNAMLLGSIDLAKLLTNPLARANHTGTQVASTISDFDTQVRTNRLNQMAVPTADVNFSTAKITNLGDPISAQDAATKAYVDTFVNGLSPKDTVRVASTANGNIATAFENGDSVDSVTLATGDRILLKNQSAGAENGIYTVNASGAPTRSVDADSSADLLGAAVFVSEGTVNGNTLWVMTTDGPLTVGTTALVWSQFGGPGAVTGGSGITVTGQQVSITAPVTVALGGTNATTVAGAKTSLGFMTRFAASVGDGAATSFNVDHTLGTLDVVVSVYRNSDGAEVICDITRTTTNRVVVAFAVAPASNAYRVVVIG